jgi:hypothetical protein
LKEALQILTDRGAEYYPEPPEQQFTYEVLVPIEFDPQPFVITLEMATDAVTDVKLESEPKTIIYA